MILFLGCVLENGGHRCSWSLFWLTVWHRHYISASLSWSLLWSSESIRPLCPSSRFQVSFFLFPSPSCSGFSPVTHEHQCADHPPYRFRFFSFIGEIEEKCLRWNLYVSPTSIEATDCFPPLVLYHKGDFLRNWPTLSMRSQLPDLLVFAVPRVFTTSHAHSFSTNFPITPADLPIRSI